MMKLVFAADHMQILLEPGVKRIGSAPDADIVLRGEGVRGAARHPPAVSARMKGTQT